MSNSYFDYTAKKTGAAIDPGYTPRDADVLEYKPDPTVTLPALAVVVDETIMSDAEYLAFLAQIGQR